MEPPPWVLIDPRDEPHNSCFAPPGTVGCRLSAPYFVNPVKFGNARMLAPQSGLLQVIRSG